MGYSVVILCYNILWANILLMKDLDFIISLIRIYNRHGFYNIIILSKKAPMYINFMKREKKTHMTLPLFLLKYILSKLVYALTKLNQRA